MGGKTEAYAQARHQGRVKKFSLMAPLRPERGGGGGGTDKPWAKQAVSKSAHLLLMFRGLTPLQSHRD